MAVQLAPREGGWRERYIPQLHGYSWKGSHHNRGFVALHCCSGVREGKGVGGWGLRGPTGPLVLLGGAHLGHSLWCPLHWGESAVQ